MKVRATAREYGRLKAEKWGARLKTAAILVAGVALVVLVGVVVAAFVIGAILFPFWFSNTAVRLIAPSASPETQGLVWMAAFGSLLAILVLAQWRPKSDLKEAYERASRE